VTYTAIDLAVLKAKGELDAARELIQLPRQDLALVCQMCDIRTKPKSEKIDLVGAILAVTHPHQTKAAPPAEAEGEQMRLF
jgi:hypothetical protein